MAFRFPLQVVLHYRQSVEHQQELRLRAANQQVTRIRHVIQQLEASLEQMERQRREQLAAGTSAAELRFSLSCSDAIRTQRQAMRQELHRLEKLRDEQQRIFQRARRERETFENLRERQRRKYEQEVSRREQRQLDEFFLLRQSYLQHRERNEDGSHQ